MKKGSEQELIKRLCKQLKSLRSIVPPRPNSLGRTSVIIDALQYIEEMKEHIQKMAFETEAASALMSSLTTRGRRPTQFLQHRKKLIGTGQSPKTHVEVIGQETGLEIHVLCDNRPGLLVAIMEACEGFGLMFMKVDIQCGSHLRFDALGAKNPEGKAVDAEEVRKMVLRAIGEQSTCDGA